MPGQATVDRQPLEAGAGDVGEHSFTGEMLVKNGGEKWWLNDGLMMVSWWFKIGLIWFNGIVLGFIAETNGSG